MKKSLSLSQRKSLILFVVCAIFCFLSCSEFSIFKKGMLEGKIFQCADLIFQVDFYKKDSVKVSIYDFGEYLQPYNIVDSVVNISFLENNPIKFKVVNENEIILIASPSFSKQKSYKRVK